MSESTVPKNTEMSGSESETSMVMEFKKITKSVMKPIKNIFSTEDAAQIANTDDENLFDDVVLPTHLTDKQNELLMMMDDGLQQKASPVADCARNGKLCCIYRVEQSFKKVHEDSAITTFHPKIVSIGPFHYNKSEDLEPMEEYKWKFFNKFLKSMNVPKKMLTTSPPTAGDTIASTSTTDDDKTNIMTWKKQYLVAVMEKLEVDVRAYYSETFDYLDSNEFRMMMLLDGCFIIQILLLFKQGPEDQRITWESTFPHLRHDLLLLENQLPFIVLDKIFRISGKKEYKLTDLILDFFNPVLFREPKVLDKCKKLLSKDTGHNHLLHLFMCSFQNNLDEQLNKSEDQHFSLKNLEAQCPAVAHDQSRSINCVTELREAGIVFKKINRSDFLHIDFSRGTLYIPTLFIKSTTFPVLLNFVAYEQRHHSIKPYFTSYLMFLDGLVDSSKDVEYLHYRGIINHELGSDEEAAALFNKLCKEVVLDLGVNNYLSKVFTEVN